MMFILQRIGAPLILLVVSIGLFWIQNQPFVAQVPFANFPNYINLAAWACFLLFFVFLIFAFLASWIIYANYKFSIGDNCLKIKRGILNKEEVSIPYGKIQDVDIHRDLSFQILGLSQIVILTAGHEDSVNGDDAPAGSGESEGYLPALDRNLAEWLQAELLKRANVQKVTMEK